MGTPVKSIKTRLQMPSHHDGSHFKESRGLEAEAGMEGEDDNFSNAGIGLPSLCKSIGRGKQRGTACQDGSISVNVRKRDD